MKYQAILFDFDFTLGDASASIYEGFCHAMEKMGYPRPTFEAVRLTIGAMLEDGFTQLTGEKDPEKRSEFRRWFQEKVEGRQAEKTVLFPGAEDLLRTLHQKGVKLGVVTNKRSTTLHEILDRFELTPLMSFTTGGEMVKAAKPDPEGLNKGIQALGADRSAVLYCGDTVIDAATARNAGVDFCAVLNGTTPGEDFAPYPSVHIAPDLPELKTWLEG